MKTDENNDFVVYDRPSHASEIGIDPDGKYVYGANRGHDSIAVFEVKVAICIEIDEFCNSK